jgi:hypothetical protein
MGTNPMLVSRSPHPVQLLVGRVCRRRQLWSRHCLDDLKLLDQKLKARRPETLPAVEHRPKVLFDVFDFFLACRESQQRANETGDQPLARATSWAAVVGAFPTYP